MRDSRQRLVDFVSNLVEARQQDDCPERPSTVMPGPSSRLPAVSSARHALEEGGPDGFGRWLRASSRTLLADTSLERLQARSLGGRARTADLRALASEAVSLVPELCSLEVSSFESPGEIMTGAKECPFSRIEELRDSAPGLVLRATVSAATALGRTVTPPAALGAAASTLASCGVDVIRVSDPFNDADRLSAAVDAVAGAGVVVEGAVCIGGALHPSRAAASYLDAAVAVAATLERHGVHAIAIEDHFGALRPVPAYTIVRAVRREVPVPVWVRFVDGGGVALAAALSAVEAGAVGVDTVVPSLAGPGLEPSSVALASALQETEREPEVEPLLLVELDRRVAALLEILGGGATPRRPPPDAADSGVAPDVLDRVLALSDSKGEISADHALAACHAAWVALGEPAMVAPVREALVLLATQLIDGDEPAGRLLDRARADDPQGLIDSVVSLREGGFAELGEIDQVPEDRDGLLSLLWGKAAVQRQRHVAHYGDIQLVPGEVVRYGLGPGDGMSALVDGRVREIRIVAARPGERPEIEVDGEPVGRVGDRPSILPVDPEDDRW